ncbi:hypothetical protein [Streptomyces sp. enrichment culture]|uniref:hypothetical protein n=1 Tax=Streptomyces sp. enrichment culture TaxID=1795815 RepID=UPI003F56D318
MAVLLTTGCGGGASNAGTSPAKPDGKGTPDASASASPVGQGDGTTGKTVEQVEEDLGSATASRGDLLFLDDPNKKGCRVNAALPTRKVLDAPALQDIIHRLQRRGWTPDGPVEQVSDGPGGMSMGRAEAGEWGVLLGTTPVPEEVAEAYSPNEGVVTISASAPCGPAGDPPETESAN